LDPLPALRQIENDGDFTQRLALQEELQALPWHAVWDYYCLQADVAGHEHGGLSPGDAPDEIGDAPHRLAGTNEGGQLALASALAQTPKLFRHRLVPRRATEHQRQCLDRPGRGAEPVRLR
jgi:hypothetical protein